MTDLPRRSYPLVVAPPGGFEDAVRRGRKIRRKRAGGSSGLALVLVGAIGYGVLGGGGGVDRIQPTDDKRPIERPTPMPGGIGGTALPSAEPSASADGRPVALPTSGTVSGGARPRVSPTAAVGPQPDHKPPSTGTTRPYARRNGIDRTGPYTNAPPQCLSQQEQAWCAFASADDSQGLDNIYTFTYTLCRSVNFGATTLTFSSDPELDFAATDTDHDDTVWTYSRGVRKVANEEDVQFGTGQCVDWKVVWDGLDDFGLLPPQGAYVLTVRPLSASEALPPAQATFDHK